MPTNPPKSVYDKFVTDWEGRKQWAQSAGIPFNDFQAVVKYDYNRMTNSQGYATKMSDTEAFDALAALKSGKDPFTTPASTPPTIFSNPLGAVRSNIQSIVTGLFHAPEAIYHDFDQAVHGHFGGVASLIPGYTDLTDLFSAQGRQYLAQNPVSDMLDVMGIGKIADLGANALKDAGAPAAADLMSKIPDHPVSKGFVKTFNTAADHMVSVKKLQEYGTRTLGAFGQLEEQKNMILRPFRAAQYAIKQMVWPDTPGSLSKHNLDFGHIPEGKRIMDTMNELGKDLKPEDINLARNMFNYSIIDRSDANALLDRAPDLQQTATPDDFLNSPNVSEGAKTLYRSFQQAATNLRFAEWTEYNKIMAVTHPITGELGWAGVNSGWFRYLKSLNKVLDTKLKNQTSLGTAIKTIYNSMKTLHDTDAGLPAALKGQNPDQIINLTNSLRRVADYYRSGNRIDPGRIDRSTTEGRQAFGRSQSAVARVFGHEGKLQSVISKIGSLKNGSDAQLIRDINSVRNSIMKLKIPHDEIYVWTVDALQKAKEDIQAMGDSQKAVGTLRDNFEASQRTADRIQKRLEYNWNRFTQQDYAAMVQRKLLSDIRKYIKDHYDPSTGMLYQPKRLKGKTIGPEEVQKGITEAELKNYGDPSVQALIPPGEWAKMNRDAWLSVREMKNAGASPYFVTGVSLADEQRIAEGNYASITDISKTSHRSVEHERAPVLTSTIFNPIYGIPKEAIDIYRQELIGAIQKDFIPNITFSNSDLVAMARADMSTKIPPSEMTDTFRVAKYYADAHGYEPYNPNLLFNPSTERALLNPTNMWIKTYNARLLKSTVSELDRSLTSAWDKMMQVYRFGVLYASPRYAAHITLGGGLMTLLRLEHPILTPLRFSKEAWAMAKSTQDYGMMVSRGVSEQDARGALVASPFRGQLTDAQRALMDEPQATHGFLAGRKLAQLFHEARSSRLGQGAGSTLDSYRELLEHVSNFQRSLAMIEGEAYANPADLTPDVLAEAKRWNTTPEKVIGARAARKVLADMQTVSPMERAVLMRFAVPFWGWTRHILRYVATYPADHPLRASIINSVSQEAIGDNSVLPNYLFRLLFLGQPNAQGNVWVLDDRQWNPFRDVANYMTWGGMMSQLNPVLQAVTASAWGVNSVTGGPDLFPQLTFDSFYGSDTAAPTGGNFFVDLAKQISPQIDTLLNVAKQTSSMRQQAAQNPGQLAYLIGDSLGVPWIPEEINTKKIQVKGTTDQEVLASNAVQSALTQNSMAPLAGYSGLLPFSGYEVNRNYIEQLINQALAFNKANKTSIPALDLVSIPYASEYVPEFITPAQP